MSYHIALETEPTEEDLNLLAKGLQSYTEAIAGIEERRSLCFFLRDEQGALLGGVEGSFGNYGWLWVGSLWVSEQLRGKNLGIQLLQAIEDEARNQACTHVYLNSFSFQAVSFYERHGYTIYGQLEDFPPGHTMSSLKKAL